MTTMRCATHPYFERQGTAQNPVQRQSVRPSTAPARAPFGYMLHATERNQPEHFIQMYNVAGPHQKAHLAQQTAELGVMAGRLWLSNPTNAMRMPAALLLADSDNSGTIDRDEFRSLVHRYVPGGFRGSEQMFTSLDKDGDGNLDRKELAKMFSYGKGNFRSLTSGR